ncbi:DUF454 family protein [Bacteroides thetaiotaomicron]|uniref:DUF454 family protein n=1 Tax=Bacteroides thetaiotaomicron TaxID=818 RepID=UPI000DE58E64|nr:DUF454 family protein [Bacteroides thetaiotaomicron]
MKTLYIVLGSISFGLGILGIFLPLLPTTLSVTDRRTLFQRVATIIYWLLITGTSVHTSAISGKQGNTVRAQIISLVLMWGTMLYCIFFLIPFLWVKFFWD